MQSSLHAAEQETSSDSDSVILQITPEIKQGQTVQTFYDLIFLGIRVVS